MKPKILKYASMSLITYDNGNAFDIKKFNKISNCDFIKPNGGLWASPVNSAYGWKEWCIKENFRTLSTKFTFAYSGNFLVVDEVNDLDKMDWYISRCGLTLPDFESMEKRGVDAIHLTKRGQEKTRFSYPRDLYGWDCECVLVLNPNGVYRP